MVNDKIRRFDCHVLLFAIQYVTLNINKLDFDTNKVCFVESMVVSLYTPNYLAHELRRQHIYSSFTDHVPVLCFFLRAPSLHEGRLILTQ